MLTFMRELFRDRQRVIPNTPISTAILYHRNNISYVVELMGGPGGVIELDEEQTQELLVSVDPRHYIGAISAQLTAPQIQNNALIQALMAATPAQKLKK